MVVKLEFYKKDDVKKSIYKPLVRSVTVKNVDQNPKVTKTSLANFFREINIDDYLIFKDETEVIR